MVLLLFILATSFFFSLGHRILLGVSRTELVKAERKARAEGVRKGRIRYEYGRGR